MHNYWNNSFRVQKTSIPHRIMFYFTIGSLKGNSNILSNVASTFFCTSSPDSGPKDPVGSKYAVSSICPF